MMAAFTSSKLGNDTILLEKMNSIGKKLLITGKGRCNITNALPIDEFMDFIPGNGKFLYSSFKEFNNKDIINILEEQGVKTKIERGNRIFPVSDKSQDVLKVFEKLLKQYGTKVRTNTRVKKILIKEKRVVGVETEAGEKINADKVIIATGGKSYPGTGSTGDGYELAKSLGHTIIDIKPSLVPLNIVEKNICKQMQGLSLRNVKIKVVADTKIVYEDFGEMLFTHFGVSGPIILSASAIILRYKNIGELLKNRKVEIEIDLKPALDTEKLDNRLLRDFNEAKNKQFKNSLDKILPQKMIPIIIHKSGINEEKPVNEITKQERKMLSELLKKFTLTIDSLGNIDEAIITAGGISTKEINPKTMESKLINGLFFAGEVIDVDAYTGGFNLQIAWSTGFVAGSGDIL